ncbi:MAG: MCP four helix bundle domain-containing protein [Sporomusaceae bacterium]|jgi:hypothetical protein|nr:MCP four helix bundle domain-containing protein [Sporomusaceae bacterium]
MTVSKKLFIGFFLVIIIAVIVGLIGITGMQKLRESEISLYEKEVKSLEYVNKAAVVFEKIVINRRQIALASFYDDKKSAYDNEKLLEENVQKFKQLMYQSRELATTQEALAFHERIFYVLEN